jgi:hypothetical protein
MRAKVKLRSVELFPVPGASGSIFHAAEFKIASLNVKLSLSLIS